MRGLTVIHCPLIVGIAVSVLGCAGRTPAPADPSTSRSDPVSTSAAESQPADMEAADAPRTSQPGEVDMEFKDKGDDNRRTYHEAPPTGAWKPVEKDKALDSKKESATAAR